MVNKDEYKEVVSRFFTTSADMSPMELHTTTYRFDLNKVSP